MQSVAAIACAVASSFLCSSTNADERPDTPGSIRTAGGPVRGVVSDGIVSYEGIPYAAPPVGALRWRRPVAPAPWQSTLEANDFGHSCPQPLPVRRVPSESRAATISEDCLTLNVSAPASHAAPLPVMVWIHGGGNTVGSASDRFTDGSTFARDGVVLVSCNYRLGLLGFFAHPALTGETDGAANFGLLDQIAALRWVHENIAAFGGDPANVTVFGESAGGEDAVLLAASPGARGLFRRAIAESPGDLWGNPPSLSQARERGAKLATRFGLGGARATADQLRALPAETLANAGDDEQIGLVVDGAIVASRASTRHALDVRVPLLIGTNDGEGSLVSGYADPQHMFVELSPADLAFVRAHYAARGAVSDAEVTERLFRDGALAAPARWAARSARTAGQPAFLYRFDYVLSGLADRRPAAPHGSEIPFVFEHWPVGDVSETDRRVGSALHECWIAFARSGTPSCSGVPAWTPYDRNDGKLMVFDAHPAMREPDDTAVLDLLEKRLLRS